MTRLRLGLLGSSTALAMLGGCAAPPNLGGAEALSPYVASAQSVPGPGWLLLGTHGDGSVFMHPRSTLRVGSSAYITLVASKRRPEVLPGGLTLGSLRERIEIDCEGARYRRHDATVHPDQVANGPVLGRVGQDQWRDVRPDTVIAAVSAAVCNGVASPPPPGFAPPPPPALPRFHRNRGGTFST